MVLPAAALSTPGASASIVNPAGITAGPDGALWFTNQGNNTIGRIDPTTGTITNYTSPSISFQQGIPAAGIAVG
ncbi:MAG TPA: hypothetical protein VG123_37500, partial [Streptosporangiaceae bacterium]|nr:hypothetical protein [Streptosporangiaceae bacterium]